MFLVCLRLIPPSHIIPSKADSVASPNCSLIAISSVQWKGPDQRTTANSSSSLLLKRMNSNIFHYVCPILTSKNVSFLPTAMLSQFQKSR